jgi:hypothetical protein
MARSEVMLRLLPRPVENTPRFPITVWPWVVVPVPVTTLLPTPLWNPSVAYPPEAPLHSISKV